MCDIAITTNKVDEKTVKDFLFTQACKFTEKQIALFVNMAVKSNLDPFKREIYDF